MRTLWILFPLIITLADARSPPNIVFILADDLGWHDVGFHGSEIKTPNIDKLAYEGVILNNYYVQPICTPTRGAVMSGKYPIHTGLQHYVIVGSQPYGLPLTVNTLPQRLRSLGYNTHMVGKWHLGFFKKEYLPEHRGFDSHFGYYMGHSDFFDHHSQDSKYIGYDLHHNGKTVWNYSEVYSTEMYTRHAEEIIKTHNQSKPLFLYLAHQAVHAGNGGDPIQAPQRYINRFPYIKDVKRRMFAGVVSALDDSVGAVYKALQDTGMADNTIIVFSTDNGGPTNGYDQNAACNWPLRGNKNTLWQGGVRGVGFVHSALLEKPGRVSEGMVHVVDWLPTLLQAAQGDGSRSEQQSGKTGVEHSILKAPQSAQLKSTESMKITEAYSPPDDDSDLDGIGLWSEISGGAEEGDWPRQEVLLNIDPVDKFGGIIVGDFKLVYGKIGHKGWYPPPGSDKVENIFQDGHFINRDDSNGNDISREGDVHHRDGDFERPEKSNILLFTSESEMLSKSTPITIECGPMPANASTNCEPKEAPCLFHLQSDPCEYNNLASELPDIVTSLKHRLHQYRKTMVAPGNKPADPKGNPQLNGGVWVPWL